jgi:hypothetical protein
MQKRKKHLIKPRLQLLFSLVFLATSGVYVVMQAIFTFAMVTRLQDRFPAEANLLVPEIVGVLKTNVAITFAVLVPLTLMVGVLATFRIAGPLHRFEVYLKAVLRGEDPGECHLRQEDELKELARLITEATRAQRLENVRADERVAAGGAPRLALVRDPAPDAPSGEGSQDQAETA